MLLLIFILLIEWKVCNKSHCNFSQLSISISRGYEDLLAKNSKCYKWEKIITWLSWEHTWCYRM